MLYFNSSRDFRVVVLRQPLYGSFQLSISESLFCANRQMGRFSCRFPSRCFEATVVSVVDFRVVVLQQRFVCSWS